MVALSAYVGNDASDLAAFSHWLGRPVDHVLFYLNDWNWAAFDSSVPWAADLWKGSGADVIWSVPLVVQGASLEQAAAGAFDGHYKLAANALAQSADSSGPIYVRVGWEFNGDWMPWSAKGHEDAFIGAFRDLVQTFRGVSDRFKFVWDVNIGGSVIDPATAYPGDAYVDVVGTDFYYNLQWDSPDGHAAFQSKVNGPYGLQWQQDFAAAHHKATAVSEWGVQSDNAEGYIQDAARWFNDHGMVFQNYWETNAANFNGQFHAGQNPHSGAAFKAAFGPAGSSGGGPASAPGASLDPDAAGVGRLYWAILGRDADQGGQTAFTSAVKHGASPSDVAATMLNSQEFHQQHGSMASSAFVDLLYQGALGRSADGSGLHFWQGLLDSGVSRASVAVGIAQSADAQQHLASQIHTAWTLL
ncbi:DUF4214 domain-containing protein [Alsobacter sp. KACC 23698]|uniref:DUF4214 domain-containing protein n=1 Tax=Alsobacter sp. KACC 23698 TaxID=3149229 RepID=A0AAU7JJP0_9HYPH